jgi:purine-binding chemotaxis protein CheW
MSPSTRIRWPNLASTVPTTEVAPRRLVLFRLGDRTYGIDLASVREIQNARAATRLPGAPDAVQGLINVRGTVGTVVDLACALGLRGASGSGAVIFVEHGTKLVGVAVDEVVEVQRWADDGLEAAPSDVQAGGAVRALGAHAGGVVVVVDVHDLLSHVLA